MSYKHLSREEILTIIDNIKIGNHYRKKLRRIQDEKKLQKEFKKIITKYEKFINLKEQVHKLIKRKRKIKSKKRVQRGGKAKNLTEIQTQLKQMVTDLDGFQDDREFYRKQIQDVEKNLETFTNQELLDQITSLQDEIERMQKQRDEKILQKLPEQEMTNAIVTKLQEEKAKLTNQITELLDKNTKLETENNALVKDIQEDKNYDEMIRNLEQSKLALETENKNNKIKMNENQQQIANLLEQLNTAQQGDIPKLQAQIEQLEQKNRELEFSFKDINACKKNLTATETRILEMQGLLDDKDKILREMADKNIELEKQIQDLINRLAERKAEIGKLNDMTGSLSTERDELKQQIDNLNKNLETHKNQIEQEKEKFLEEQEQYSKKQREQELEKFREQQLEMQKLQDEYKKLQDNLKSVEDKQVDTDKQREEKERELEKLKQEIKKQQEEKEITKKLIEQEKDRDEDEEKAEEITDELLDEQDTPKEPESEPEKVLQKELEKVNKEMKDESAELKAENPSQWLLNKAENIIATARELSDTVPMEELIPFLEEKNQDVETEMQNVLTKEFTTVLSNIKKNYNYIRPQIFEKDDLDIQKDIFTDSDFVQLGGKRRFLKGGNANYTLLYSRLNKNISTIRNINSSYNFILDLSVIFKGRYNSYLDALNNPPKNIMKRMSKGVLVLYLRLITDIMKKWEAFKWFKITDTFFEYELGKIQDGNEAEMDKMINKINTFKPKFRIPDFSLSSNLDSRIVKKLEEFWNDYYIMVRKWYNVLSDLEKKIKGDQVIVINKKLEEYFYEFNILREKLDEYQILVRKPVSIYARVNDIGRDESGFMSTQERCKMESDFVCGRVKSDDYVMFSVFEDERYKNYLNIKIDKCMNIKELEKKSPELFNKFNNLAKIDNATKFEEIFFTAEFSNNKTISRYMLLDKLLGNGIGVFLVTYGYSGVGKSFTLFGNDKNPGLLQSTIQNMNNIVSTKMRIYEVYGLGMPYSEAYTDLKKLDQNVIHYNLDISGATKRIIVKSNPSRKFTDIAGYINEIKNVENDKNKSMDERLYLELPKKKNDLLESLSSISELVKQIDSVRRLATPARVKTTVNNPDSSRAVLIYEFIFGVEQEDGSIEEATFVIDDMPGLEDPVKTYITENKKKIIFEGPNQLDSKLEKYITKNHYTNVQKYIMNPMKSYQNLTLMSSLINPFYLSIVKPNDIFYYFNEQPENFRKQVLSVYKQENVKVNGSKFVLGKNKFNNRLLNTKESLDISSMSKSSYDQEIMYLSSELIEKIINICIQNSDYSPLINIITKILIESKIPSDPDRDISKIELSKEEIIQIRKMFRRKLLAPYVLNFLGTNAAAKLNVDRSNLSRFESKKKVIVEDIIKGKGWKYIKQIAKKADDMEQIFDKMSGRNMDPVTKNEIKKRIAFSKIEKSTYQGFVDAMIEHDEHTSITYEMMKQVKLYEKKQNTTYQESGDMEKVVQSFVQVAFEAWYINQNIAGVLKYYSKISKIQNEIIDRFVPKQDIDLNRVISNKARVNQWIDKLFGSDGLILNMGDNFDLIFHEIKRNIDSTKLFQTPEQDENNELIVREMIDPYTMGDKARIEDFKMFYVMSNNNTQLKCLNQLELFANTKEFIERIGEN